MATDIVGSLFGMTPEQLQMARQAQMQKSAADFAALTPAQQVSYGSYLGGQQLGNALGGLMGAEDPMLKLVQQRQMVAKQIDWSNPQSILQGINLLKDADPAGARGLAEQYRKLVESNALVGQRVAQEKLATAQQQKLETADEREKRLQDELAKLPPDATEQQLQAVLRRYGDPKTVLSSLERQQTVRIQAEERAKIEQDRQRFLREKMESDQQFKREIAQMKADQQSTTDTLKQQLLQEKIDALQEKKQAAVEKQLASAEGVVANTEVVLSKINEAEKLMGGWMTTGWGSYLSVVPGTKSKALASAIETIKARLGFDQLNQMRQASPTGGALGPVAVKELVALQSAIASLDQSLDEDTLRKNLQQIKESYSRWRDASLNKLPADRQPTATPAAGTSQNPIKLK